VYLLSARKIFRRVKLYRVGGLTSKKRLCHFKTPLDFSGMWKSV
jgi:hypothetical protein